MMTMTEKYKILGKYIKDMSSETPNIETYIFVKDNISKYQLGIDGISMFLIICAALLTAICIFATWKSIKSRVGEETVVLLVLETTLIGSFCALDIFLFACFVIAASIPLHLMVGMWNKNSSCQAFFNFGINIFTFEDRFCYVA